MWQATIFIKVQPRALDFKKINTELIRETTYTDRDIQQGQRYYYVITAVDSAQVPNESEKSNETSEVAKKQ